MKDENLKKIVSIVKKYIHIWRLECHYKNELKEKIKKSPIEIKPLSYKQKKQIRDYYRSMGFERINTKWHEFYYSVTGDENVKILPENFYHIVIEPMFTRNSEWEDKNYMSLFLPGVRFPKTIIRNVNGYYLDNHGNFLTKKEAISLVNKKNDVIIKPSLETGGGKNVTLIKGNDFGDNLINQYGKNFIIQEKLKQSDQMAKFNVSSVNTEKIISFLYNGEVFILTSILRIGAKDSIIDNVHSGNGLTVGIQEDGKLNNVSYSIYGEKNAIVHDNKMCKNVELQAHKKICEIIKIAHKKLPYFGLISWDFAVDKDGNPVLIEYNLDSPDITIQQLNNGPLFGEHTDEWLKVISCKKKHI